MADVKPIRREADYEGALAEVERLWGAKSGMPRGDRLDVLATLIDAWESEHHPMDPPDPIEAIKFRMEQQNLTRKDLEGILGTRTRVAEVLNRRRGLSINMIRRRHKELGIPAEVLIRSSRLKPPPGLFRLDRSGRRFQSTGWVARLGVREANEEIEMVRKSSRAAEDALIEAQDLAFEAWEATTSARRKALAKKALALSPLCADAYNILAAEARAGSDDQLDLWRRGVAAGEEALGKKAFAEMAGHFWDFLESRPYMRARFGLATALWERGTHDEAIDHARAMLALNPNDSQGVRYSLAAWLAERERDGDLEALLADYADEYSAFWGWTKALLAFRKSGDTPESRKQLAEAVEINAHVRDYLCGDKPMPRRLPSYYSPGDPSEAIFYIEGFRVAWQRTAGALDWLRSRLPAAKKSARRKTVH